MFSEPLVVARYGNSLMAIFWINIIEIEVLLWSFIEEIRITNE